MDRTVKTRIDSSFKRTLDSLKLAQIVMALVFSSTAHAAWPTHQFEIVQGEPDSVFDAFAEGLGFGDVGDGVKTELENYLAEVAQEYDRLGFPAPQIDYRTQGGYAYKVFAFDYANASPAQYKVSCRGAESNRYIRIDSSGVDANTGKKYDLGSLGNADPKIYEHLAHELFHAVQGSYDLFFDNCDLGDWIVEGTAQAIGIDMASKLRGVEPRSAQIRWAARHYFTPLRIADDDAARRDEAYWTASLWRYIGEHIRASPDGRAGTKKTQPDYSYFVKLFQRNLAGPPSEITELEWLDEGLTSMTRLGLERIYPYFVSTFSGYVPARAATRDKAAAWRDWIFDGCPRIDLSPTRTTGSVTQDLRRVAARCFEVAVAVPDRVDLTIHAYGPGRAGLESLTIGTADGTKVGPARVVERPTGSGNYFASWLFRIPTTDPQPFIVSNVAPKAHETSRQTPTLHVTYSSWSSNLTRPDPQVQPGRSTESKASGPGQPKPATRATAEELESGIQALSAHVAGGATTRRMPAQAPCPNAFVFQPCGPITTIGLSLVPGSFGQLGYVTATGGLLAQTMDMFSGMAGAGAIELGEGWMEAAKRVGNMDGAEVRIIIPLIDYGYSGAFSNAFLTVSAAGDEVYEAIGPQDALPGKGIEFALAGQVSIEEYSPYVLRGTFSGDLVNMNRVPVFTEDNPTLPIHTHVEGDFNIVAPWQGDKRATAILPADNPDQLRQDLQEAFPLADAEIDKLIEQMMEDRAQDRAPAAAGIGSNACDCSCNFAENADPVCEPVCKATFQACSGDNSEVLAQFEAPRTGAEDEVLELRRKYEELLESQHPGEEYEGYRLIMLEAFDFQETLAAKQLMYDRLAGELY